jgi:hypothetical protein
VEEKVLTRRDQLAQDEKAAEVVRRAICRMISGFYKNEEKSQQDPLSAADLEALKSLLEEHRSQPFFHLVFKPDRLDDSPLYQPIKRLDVEAIELMVFYGACVSDLHLWFFPQCFSRAVAGVSFGSHEYCKRYLLINRIAGLLSVGNNLPAPKKSVAA